MVDGPHGVRLLVAAKLDWAMEARIEGELAVLDGGCLGLRAGGDAEAPTTTLVWPNGTRALSPGGVVLPGGETPEIGQAVVFGGGGVSEELADSGFLPAIPADCPDHQVFLVSSVAS